MLTENEQKLLEMFNENLCAIATTLQYIQTELEKLTKAQMLTAKQMRNLND